MKAVEINPMIQQAVDLAKVVSQRQLTCTCISLFLLLRPPIGVNLILIALTLHALFFSPQTRGYIPGRVLLL